MYDAKDGKRQPLYAAVERYKRLDWGMYVGTKTGEYTKISGKPNLRLCVEHSLHP